MGIQLLKFAPMGASLPRKARQYVVPNPLPVSTVPP